jgi:hypothetical protein
MADLLMHNPSELVPRARDALFTTSHEHHVANSWLCRLIWGFGYELV